MVKDLLNVRFVKITITKFSSEVAQSAQNSLKSSSDKRRTSLSQNLQKKYRLVYANKIYPNKNSINSCCCCYNEKLADLVRLFTKAVCIKRKDFHTRI